jgi:hypothetical protein
MLKFAIKVNFVKIVTLAPSALKTTTHAWSLAGEPREDMGGHVLGTSTVRVTSFLT